MDAVIGPTRGKKDLIRGDALDRGRREFDGGRKREEGKVNRNGIDKIFTKTKMNINILNFPFKIASPLSSALSTMSTELFHHLSVSPFLSPFSSPSRLHSASTTLSLSPIGATSVPSPPFVCVGSVGGPLCYQPRAIYAVLLSE